MGDGLNSNIGSQSVMSWEDVCALLLVTAVYARYDEDEARMLIKLASGAYGNETQINNCTSQALSPRENHVVLTVTTESCDSFDNPCVGYIVASQRAKVLYVVFRGTKSKLILQGWSTLKPGKDFFGMGLVNRYFFKGHRLLWYSVNKTLTDPTYSKYRVVFTGHSLGGALATLAAARTARDGLRKANDIRLITFGAPRVGSAQFAFNLDYRISESYRVVFRKDLVPHMPPCEKDTSNPLLSENDSRPCDPSAINNAYHHGTEIWYPESMDVGSSYKICKGMPKNEDFSCSNQFKYKLKNFDMYTWDHRHYFSVRVPHYGKSGCDVNYRDILGV